MHRILFLAATLAACGHPAPPAPPPLPSAPPATEASAQAAYDAKHYADCAAQLAQLAAARTGDKAAELRWSEASCEALGGQADAAFAALDRGLAAGLHQRSEIEKDPDLAPLHADQRWAGFVAKLVTAETAFLGSIAEPKLREELHRLVATDQAARMGMIKDRDNKELLAKVEDSDRASTARMHEIVAAYGWPGKKLVGKDGAHDAWLLLQHADRDLAFQKQCLALMQPLLASEDVAAIDVAYLDDRVAVAEHRPQTYGTQFGPDREPQPMVDPANVDARRKAIGLGTMAEYRVQMRAMYGDPIKK
ncbi:MAG TPA: DUF6624 domain-containing protein [Kofleriaceae bacterium]|nr:DUF6624 domain-containing protein [Kofleriaceae bacterium]